MLIQCFKERLFQRNEVYYCFHGNYQTVNASRNGENFIVTVFILENALSVGTNLGKHSLFVWLFVSSVKTGTRRIIRPDELSSAVRRSSCTTEDSSSQRR